MRRVCDGVVRWLFCGVMMVLAVGLSGCGSGPPPGVPAGSSGQVSSGSAGGSGGGSVDARAGSPSVSQADLDAEAERVYRAFFDEEQKIFLAGGAESLPDSVKPFVTGDFAKMTEAGYQELHKRGWKQQPGTRILIAGLESDHTNLSSNSIAVLLTCVDSRESGFQTASGELLPGGIDYMSIFFSRTSDDNLRIYNSKTEVVEKCPLGS